MQILRISLSIWLMTLCALTPSIDSSTIPEQEQQLIDLLYQNKVRLITMRHGEALHNLGHLMTSIKSPGIYLTDKGISQVQQSAQNLSKEQIDRMYVSPVYRTMQTAQIVGNQLNLPYQKMVVEERLREQFFGIFEDRTYEEYDAYFSSPEEVFIYAAPGGEAGSELFARTRDLLLKIAVSHPNETVLLVTHAYNCCQISKCLTGSYQGLPEKAEYKIYDFSHECRSERLEAHSAQ